MDKIYHRAVEYFEMGKYYEAIELFSQLPSDTTIKYNIATCYKEINTVDSLLKSIDMYTELLHSKRQKIIFKTPYVSSEQIKVNYSSSVTRLISIYHDSSNIDKAFSILEIAIKEIPNNYYFVYNLGHLQLIVGDYTSAYTNLNKALNLQHVTIDTYLDLICVSKDLGNYPKALEIAQRGIADGFDKLSLYSEIGIIQTEMLNYEAAKKTFQMAIDFYNDIMQMECKKTRPTKIHEKISKVYLNFGHLYSTMGNTEKNLMYCDKSICAIDKHISETPSDHEKYDAEPHRPVYDTLPIQNYLMALLYVPLKPDAIVSSTNITECNYNYVLRKHFEYGSKITQLCQKKLDVNLNYDNLAIHIGFVSGDFSDNHPMFYFLRELMNNYDSNKFTFYCYSASYVKNINIFSPYVKWRFIKYAIDSRCIELILSDRIDILFDLSGHTAGNKMRIFSNRVAKYQLSYLGYPCITGMPNIDYYVIDNTFNYTGSKILTMPHCFTHYTPKSVPTNLVTPYNLNNYITFGSLNKVTKFNKYVVQLWDKILDAYPNAKLMIKKTDLYTFRNNDRVVMFPQIHEFDAYINKYNEIDISLDTFPYAGTTTTCESLLMGTPVITLADRVTNAIHQNTTASLLINSNLEYLVATDETKYFEIIENVIKNIQTNPSYKNDIQKSFLSGNVTNGKQYINDFETLMKKLMSHN